MSNMNLEQVKYLFIVGWCLISIYLCMQVSLLRVVKKGNRMQRFDEQKRLDKFIRSTIIFTFPLVIYEILVGKSYKNQ